MQVSVKGAPETIKSFLAADAVPEWYDETYKWYTRRGSRVLALAWKDLGSLSGDRVCFSPDVSKPILMILLRLIISNETKLRAI